MIEEWKIILAVLIVGLSIVMPIYYSQKRKKRDTTEKRND